MEPLIIECSLNEQVTKQQNPHVPITPDELVSDALATAEEADVLPAAPECGGNDGLARASERVQGLGWLFGIHDNSVILFKSAPSTDPADALMRDDGTPVEGGVGAMDWQMYHCCPACMLKYVGKNYPRFRELFQLNYIYADQIAAMPVAECFSPRHPLSHQEVIETYRELLEFMRSQIPMVSSGSVPSLKTCP